MSCRRLPLGVPQPFWLQLPVLLLRWSFVVGLAVSLVCRLVFYLVLCSSSGACGLSSLPCRRLPLGVFCLFCHRVPDLLLRWWRRLGSHPSLILSVLLLRRLACRGLLGSAPCVRELPLGLCLPFGRQCNNPACFPLPSGGCASGLWCLRRQLVAKFAV